MRIAQELLLLLLLELLEFEELLLELADLFEEPCAEPFEPTQAADSEPDAQ